MFRKFLKARARTETQKSDPSQIKLDRKILAAAPAATPPQHSINERAAPFLTASDIQAFAKDGVLCIRNVLTPDQIEALRAVIQTQLTQTPQSKTAIDLEKIQKLIWGAPKSTDTSQPHSTAHSRSKDAASDMHEDQTGLEPQKNSLNQSHLTTLRMLRMVIDADPEATPNLDPVTGTLLGQYYVDTRQWMNFEALEKTACHSAIPAICAELLQTQSLFFWGDSTRVKAPNTAQRTALQQDWALVPIEGTQSCSVWVALDPTRHENGGKFFIRGSHALGKTYAANIFINQTPNPLSLYEPLPYTEDNMPEDDIIRYNVEPGDIIIHHILTLHGSGGNTTLDKPRRAITLRYCGDDIRYLDKPGALDTDYFDPPLSNGDSFGPPHAPNVWPKI